MHSASPNKQADPPLRVKPAPALVKGTVHCRRLAREVPLQQTGTLFSPANTSCVLCKDDHDGQFNCKK